MNSAHLVGENWIRKRLVSRAAAQNQPDHPESNRNILMQLHHPSQLQSIGDGWSELRLNLHIVAFDPSPRVDTDTKSHSGYQPSCVQFGGNASLLALGLLLRIFWGRLIPFLESKQDSLLLKAQPVTLSVWLRMRESQVETHAVGVLLYNKTVYYGKSPGDKVSLRWR